MNCPIVDASPLSAAVKFMDDVDIRAYAYSNGTRVERRMWFVMGNRSITYEISGEEGVEARAVIGLVVRHFGVSHGFEEDPAVEELVRRRGAAIQSKIDEALNGMDTAEAQGEADENRRRLNEGNRRSDVRRVKDFDVHIEAPRPVLELATHETLESLQQWYTNNRERLDRLVSQDLRNDLFDAIREKRKTLENN